jgi:hypothetical protein
MKKVKMYLKNRKIQIEKVGYASAQDLVECMETDDVVFDGETSQLIYNRVATHLIKNDAGWTEDIIYKVIRAGSPSEYVSELEEVCGS